MVSLKDPCAAVASFSVKNCVKFELWGLLIEELIDSRLGVFKGVNCQPFLDKD